jgi:hypothetical protein
METKQTAVQWFNQQLIDRQNGNGDKRSWDKILQQALQMEREQIEDAYGDGLNAHRVDFCNRNEYYQKTYGGQDE